MVSGRALRAVAAAATSVELGVRPRDVHVEIADDGGRLAVVVRTPVRVEVPAVADPARTMLARAESARQRVAEDLVGLAGAGVGSCRLVVTAVTAVAGTEAPTEALTGKGFGHE